MEFRFPDIGEGVIEGEIVTWHVREGDSVVKDQPLVDVETDKAVVQLPAPETGTVTKIYVREGQTVHVGDVLVTIGSSQTTAPQITEANEREPVKPSLRKTESRRVRATPVARRLADEYGIDLTTVHGSGPESAVTPTDLEPHIPRAERPHVAITKKYDFWGHVERVPLRGVRKATAQKMALAVQHAAHVVHMDEADVTELVRIRAIEKSAAQEKGVHLTYLPFIVKACVEALKEHPYLNATLDEERSEIVLKKYYNIGIAVDVDEGLVVPVVKAADQKSILEIAKEIQVLSEKARQRTLDIADMKGGTFTITNIGSIGGLFATPIINYPEVAILAVGRIHDKILIKNEKVQRASVLPLSLAFDHRVLDGAEAARLVAAVINSLENPGNLLHDLRSDKFL